MTINKTLVSITGLEARIFNLDGRPPFIIAEDMAQAYETRVDLISLAVKRNPDRFPEHFSFTLSPAEIEHLKTQNAFSNGVKRPSSRVFTHPGALALSGVLKSPVAAKVSVIIHDAFAAYEQQVLSGLQNKLVKLRSDTLAKKPIYVRIQEAQRNGVSFEELWRGTSYSRYKLEQAVEEMMILGMMDLPLKGMNVPMFGPANA